MSRPTTETFKKWLAGQLRTLVSVQRCAFGQSTVNGDPVRDPDLVVYTWSGMVIHIHLIDEPTKAPKLRRIIENATSNGIPTLFLLDGSLLPAQGERDQSDRWYIPFQNLVNERAYAYRVGEDQVGVYPVQFKASARTEIEINYGDTLPIKQLRYYRTNVKQNALKGYWLLADFETELSAKTSPFRSTDYTAYQNAGPKANGNGANANNGTSNKAKTQLESSYDLLGVKQNATREEVKAAFRKLAFAVHPDVSTLPKAEAETRFKLLTEAYDFIKKTHDWG